MKVYLNKITGIDDAIESMLMSKKSWTPEKAGKIREIVFCSTISDGTYVGLSRGANNDHLIELDDTYRNYMEKIIHYGVDLHHTTLLRFIDLSFTVEGLHRAAQDDFDSHAKRLDNRIIRASTRLADFGPNEKSDWYKDKILYFPEVLKILQNTDKAWEDMELPVTIKYKGKMYVHSDYGYIEVGKQNNRDVKRGLYPEAIPSNFIFKVQYPELCHIVQLRDASSHAHPELQQMIEEIKCLVIKAQPWLGNNLNTLTMEPTKLEN